MSNTKRTLTEQEELFLEALGGAARGDFAKAKQIAGYSPNHPTRLITKALENEIRELTQGLLLTYGPKAAMTYDDVLMDKAGMNAREKINTANQILDRIGVVKTEKVEVDGGAAAVVFLPSKKPVDMDNLY